MITTSSLLARLSKRFPKRLALQYEKYIGLMAGKLPKEVGRIYLALDFEEMIFEDALAFKPDLIITHHPFVYGTRHFIKTTDERKDAFIEKVEAAGLAVYSMHTNFDEGRGGMNDALTEALDLREVKPLLGDPMARGGKLPHPMTIAEFAAYAKKRLGAEYGLLLPYGKPIVETAAIVGGGGSKGYAQAMKEGYDVFISGDMPHYTRRTIINLGYNYLDLPHEIESIFLPQMEKILLEIDPSLIIKKAPLQVQARLI